MNISLHGKTALIGGSTQGIGFAIAQLFAECGANTVLLARNAEKLQQVKDSLPKTGEQHHEFLVADYADPVLVELVVRGYIEQGGICDIVVNNTGGPPPGAIEYATTEEFLAAFSSHILINQKIAQLVLPGMKQRQWGRILNIVSTSVKQPLAGLGVSNTIRGATASWAKTLSNEIAKHNITVNCLLPGATKTGRLEAIIQRKAAQHNISEEQAKHSIEHEIPAGRLGEPREIAGLAAFLASDWGAYITGTNIAVDGGRTNTF